MGQTEEMILIIEKNKKSYKTQETWELALLKK
jgi:hypothetical protein